MQITSPNFNDGAEIPSDFTCNGENINPELDISGVPEETRTLALIMDDPDAPMGTWVHWVVWNIDPMALKIMQGTAPAGSIEGTNSSEKIGYIGPCPPSGTHRYFFKLYALDTTLDLESGAEAADLERAMNGHILAQSELVGLYTKK